MQETEVVNGPTLFMKLHDFFKILKSKLYDEKLYKIIVAMGSSRASILGEATINLADYVDALKPSAVTLPLHGCNFGTVLHMTIQLLTSKTGFREFEQQRELRERGLESGVDGHSHSVPTRIPHSDEVNARIKLNTDVSEVSSLDEEANMNEEYADSATGFDGSSNTSGSLYAEKHETSSTHECQSPCTVKEDPSDHQKIAQGTSGSAPGWGSDNSIDNELAMACEENNRLKGSLELAESSFFNLKLEVNSLQSLADELGAETQKVSHQLSAEISSSEELAKEVSAMKSECCKFKDDINRIKDLKVSPQIPSVETSDNQVDHLVRSMQLQFLNGISVVESKIRELQKKTYVLPHDGDTKFIYLELEVLLNFLLDFKLGNSEANVLDKADVKEIRETSRFKDDLFVSGNGLGLDLCPPESALQHFTMSPPVSEGVNPLSPIDAMKGQIFDLVRELDEAKVEKEALTQKMVQMECYYEALIHELEENQKRLLGELQHMRNEHSTCLYTLSVSKTETEALREEMNQQMLQFVDERRELEAINKELERRTTTSEAALRRARLNYSIAVDKLQKDLELLSSQVFSMFETNENLIKQALPLQPDLQVDPEDDDVAKLSQNQKQNSGLRKRSVGGDVLLEDLKRSFLMQEELYQKAQQELMEMYSINLNLDIYSIALEQSLCGADADIGVMKGKIGELLEELKVSTVSQNHLMVRLQKATDEIHTLNEYKSSSISQCSDMALQNQILEEKLVSISEENYLLSEKLKDWDNTMLEIRSYQSKYAACLAENAELSLHLKQEALENENLTNELSHLKETLMTLKAESDELVSSEGKLKENTKFVQDKLADLLSSYNKQLSLDLESTDIKDLIFQLEKIQHSMCEKNCQLMEENRSLKSEKADADVSLSTARSEILTMKQKFRSVILDMVTKLDMSNALVDKLQAELESVANKFRSSSEIEEEFAQKNQILLADLACLEDQMQDLTCQNGHLAREFSGLDSVAEELGRSKSNITELMHEKQELATSLRDKTEESVKLSCENSHLKETLKTLHDELCVEKAYKDELEGKVRDLTICLRKGQDELVEFEQKKAELMHVRELVSDLEVEKSRLSQLLDEQNGLTEKLERNSTSFESQLSEMHDYSLATDVKLIYVSAHYEAILEELQKRFYDTESMLNQRLVGEADWSREKSNLLAGVESLTSDLEVAQAETKLLSDSNDEIRDRLEECKMKLTVMENRSTDSVLQASEIERLKKMVADAEEEVNYLTLSKEELGILGIVLRGKVDEQTAHITLLEKYKDELMILRSQFKEQVLKTEEFKNLSIHLRELKDKAEAECLAARERREAEVQSNYAQDSLRIAFIKEQCETKVQELKQQVSISKKRGEEMLLKLQDAIDEIENRKKSEAVSLKKNEELSIRLSALEAELMSAISEKREKSNAYDRVKAELECALLSLECCKEEKEKLGASLLEFEAEKSQLVTELSFVKGEVEDLKSSSSFDYGSVAEVEHALNGSTGNSSPISSKQDEITYSTKRENIVSTLDGESSDSTEPMLSQMIQSNGKDLDVNNEHTGAQILRTSIEHLHEELEKMKNENTVFSIDHDLDSGSQDTQREIMQLHKANEELRSMFPSLDEISGNGNALDRVLALEIELAEALKTKNKSKIQFQSSFLKQHSDEEAVLKSFRDINELIKEMLELKGRHAAIEAELRDMHDRYSQLSLQFAEVEGERQKLKMTLKNVRSSKKLVSLNRSSSDNVMDHPS